MDRIIKLALLALAIFISLNLVVLWEDGLTVVQTGLCPAAPPDIPAYPCSLGEFLGRMLFGGWALFGQMVVAILSVILSGIIGVLYLVGVRAFRARRRQ